MSPAKRVAKKKSPKKPQPRKAKKAKKAPARRRAAPRTAPARRTKKRSAPKKARRPAPVAAEVPAPASASSAPAEANGGARDEVREIFDTYDRDGSGSIDRGELSRLLEALGQRLSEEELDVALDVVDANHSGKISWQEFSAWWSSR